VIKVVIVEVEDVAGLYAEQELAPQIPEVHE
jgi:hypothetical protein